MTKYFTPKKLIQIGIAWLLTGYMLSQFPWDSKYLVDAGIIFAVLVLFNQFKWGLQIVTVVFSYIVRIEVTFFNEPTSIISFVLWLFTILEFGKVLRKEHTIGDLLTFGLAIMSPAVVSFIALHYVGKPTIILQSHSPRPESANVSPTPGTSSQE